MKESYNVLVIDDIKDMGKNFEAYKKYLSKDYGLKVNFKLNCSIEEVDYQDAYDLLMVDYNLSSGFFSGSEKGFGQEFIEKFRSYNKVCKIIFYSSEFMIDEKKNRYKIKLSDEEVFNVVNNLKVDAILPKVGNFDLMIKTIGMNLLNQDPILNFLNYLKFEYVNNDIELFYSGSSDIAINIDELMKEYQLGTEIGRKFKNELYTTIGTQLFSYNY